MFVCMCDLNLNYHYLLLLFFFEFCSAHCLLYTLIRYDRYGICKSGHSFSYPPVYAHIRIHTYVAIALFLLFRLHTQTHIHSVDIAVECN